MGDPEHGNLDYLQLRKDTLKIPKQFYLRKELSDKLNGSSTHTMGDLLKFASNGDLDKNARLQGGHPLVPKLNLPR